LLVYLCRLVCVFSDRCSIYLFFFFFQAEDGIRDWSVTGVQTCALPISRCAGGSRPKRWRSRRFGLEPPAQRVSLDRYAAQGLHEIGRASCRERVEIWVVAVSLKKKGEERGA